MLGVSLQSLPSSELRRDCCSYLQWQGIHRSPTWPRSHQKIQCYKDVRSHTYSLKKQKTLSPFVRLLGGEGPVGKAGRGAGCFSKEEASVSPPCPKSHP